MSSTSYKINNGAVQIFNLLEYINSLPEPISAVDLKTRVREEDIIQVPDGTLMCHLATLEHAGYLRRIGGVLYETTSKVMSLSTDKRRALDLRKCAIEKQIREIEEA